MGNYLLAGFIVGTLLWGCKYMLACAILPKGFNKWLHRTPLGLLVMDTLFGVLALKTISMTGASGLTTLFVLTFYGAWTGMLVMKYLIIKKSKAAWDRIGGILP